MTDTSNRGLDGLRDTATKGLVLLLWLHVPFNTAVALWRDNGWAMPGLTATALAAAATLAWLLAGSTAVATRLVVGVSLVGTIAVQLGAIRN